MAICRSSIMRENILWPSLCLLIFTSVFAGCENVGGENDSGGFELSVSAELNLEFNGYKIGQGDTVNITAVSEIDEETLSGSFAIRVNGGTSPLIITSVEVSSDPPSLFRLEADDQLAMPSIDNPWVVNNPASSGDQVRMLRLFFKRPAEVEGVTAILTIESNTAEPLDRTLIIHVRVEEPIPEIAVQPLIVDFGTVNAGASKMQQIHIFSVGQGLLQITGFALNGPKSLSLHNNDKSWPASIDTQEGITFLEPIVLKPGTKHLMSVEFAPTWDGSGGGSLVFYSNDPAPPASNAVVSIQANL